MVKNMTEGGSLRLILAFMVPLLIGNVFQQMYNIADVIIVGRTIGVNALAAVGAVAPVFMTLVMMALGFTNGMTVVTGQLFGAGDEDGVRRSAAMCMMLSAIAVVLMMTGGLAVMDPALRLMNLPPELMEDSKAYASIVVMGMSGIVGYNLLSGLLRSLGDSKTPLYFLIISSVVNIVLALVFILQFGWGVPGSAVALVLSNILSAVLCLVFILRKLPLLRPRRSDFRWDRAFAWRHLQVGLPMMGMFTVTSLGMLLVQGVVNHFGSVAIAGFTAAMRLEQLALQPMVSFSIAMAAFTAQNYGAHRFDRIRDGVKRCSLVGLGFALTAVLLMFLLGEQMITIFVDGSHKDVIQYADEYLRISVPCYFFLSQLFIYRGGVQGMGVAIVPFISSVIELGMRTLAAMVLSDWWGFVGVCYASPIAWVAASLFLFTAYHYFVRTLERAYVGTLDKGASA